MLNGGPGADTFNIQGTPFTGTAVVVNGGSGPDTFNVQGESGALITINGGTASNVINYDARGQSIGTGAGAVAFNGRPVVLYANIGTLNLNNAAGVETIAGPDTADRSTAFAGLSAQERFVQALYLDELGRAGAKAELDGWVGVLNGSGGSQTTVAGDILHSQEARDHLVKSWYVTFLGRQADGTEELGFVNQLVQGGTEEQVLSEILGSADFYNRAQTLGGGNGLQTGHSGPEYQYLGRGDGSGGGHQHGQIPWVILGGHKYRLVTGHTGLRTKHIHSLRPASAGQHVE